MKLYSFAGKLIAHTIGLIAVYTVIVCVLCNIPYKGSDLLQSVTGNAFITGGDGQSLKRFREVQGVRNVDILFIGSSHAYRGFDPQVFRERGFSSFNMGSSSQTPLNSYFLLKQYLPTLNPKIIVIELYPVVLELDGLESTFDLSANASPSFKTFQMACCTLNPHAVTSWCGHALRGVIRPIAAIDQKKIDGETYCYGGYVKTDSIRKKPSSTHHPRRLELSVRQLCYVEKILRLAHALNIKIVGAVQPLPRETVAQYTNYAEVVERLNKICSRYGVSFTDYSEVMHLDSIQDFKDEDHLNSSGVAKFNTVLLDRLLSERMIEKP